MKEEEKLDIEDIKDPLDELDKEEVDLEEAVSEEEVPAKVEEAEEETVEEPKEVPVEEPEEVKEVPKKTKKEKKPLFKKKEKSKKVNPATVLEPVKKKKKNLWGSIVIVLLTALVTAAAVLGVVWYLNKNNQPKEEAKEEVTATEEEVTKEEEKSVFVNSSVGINLRKEPSITAEILAIIPNGTKLTILDENAGWYKVEYQNKEGWVSKEFVTKNDPGEYTNADYGFSLAFPETWSGQKAVKKSVEGTTSTYYFGLPTTDTTWSDPSDEPGFASFFAISVYTPAQWQALLAEEGAAKPTKLGEDGGYVFAWSQGQATPTDLSSKFSDVKSIIATFKLN